MREEKPLLYVTGVHGAAAWKRAASSPTDKWHTNAEELVDTPVAMAEAADVRPRAN